MRLPIVVFESETERRLYGEYFKRSSPATAGIAQLPSVQSVRELIARSGLAPAIQDKVCDARIGMSVDMKDLG
jgi:hypothetical protein